MSEQRLFAPQGEKKPFSRVIDVSSCDPHRAGMAPISFVRQVRIVPSCQLCCVPCDQSDSYKRSLSAPVILWFCSQVLAVCLYPELLEEPSLPLDVRQRAQKLLEACSGGSVGENDEYEFICTDLSQNNENKSDVSTVSMTGSYSVTACGLPLVQKRVAEFITRRDDGVSSDPEDIIVTAGSQESLWV